MHTASGQIATISAPYGKPVLRMISIDQALIQQKALRGIDNREEEVECGKPGVVNAICKIEATERNGSER